MNGASPLLETLATLRRAHTPGAVLDGYAARARSVVPSEVFGLYVFPNASKRLPPCFVGNASATFLARYEMLRPGDPLLREVLGSGATVDNLGLLGEAAWRRQPLARFLADYGLTHTVQAPVRVDGAIVGTLNFARERGYGPYQGEAAVAVRELALAVSDALDSALERVGLEDRLATLGMNPPGLAKPPECGTTNLPPRALAVARLAARGLPNKLIAQHVGSSENTVKHHLKRIFAALGVANRTELALRVPPHGDNHPYG